MKKINYKLEEGGKDPISMSSQAACLDVFARTVEYNKEFGFLSIKLGIIVEVPDGYVVDLMPRSSISKKGLIMANSPGQIDPDFRGEVEARFFPVITPALINSVLGGVDKMAGYMEGIYKVGESVAQIRLIKNETRDIDWVRVETLSETDRGEGGFGSTTQKI